MTNLLIRALLAIALCVSSASAQKSPERTAASRVSQKRLQQTVRDLVAFGNRQGGTKSGDRAAAYVAKAFKSMGLSVQTIDEPEHPTYVNDRWTLKVAEPRRLRGLIQNEALVGFSPTTASQSARLVYLAPDDPIRRKTVDSCVVLFNGRMTDRVYRDLVEAGARAVITFQESPTQANAQWAVVYSLWPSEKRPIPAYSVPASAGIRLRREVLKGTRVIIQFSAKTTIRPGKPKTVVANQKGTGSKVYIICAHGDSDSGGPGADDNASGVAGVLEIARVLTSLQKEKAIPKPDVSIRYVIWGSEYYSSEIYVKRNASAMANVAGVINFDEIGFGRSRDCIYFEGNDVEVNRDLLKALNAVGEAYAGKRGFWKESTTNPSQGGTDSYVFSTPSLKRLDVPTTDIPSVTVFCAAWDAPRTMAQTRGWWSKAWRGNPDSVTIDYCPYYHSTMDLPRFTTDKEPYNMVWAAKAVSIALLRLAWQK